MLDAIMLPPPERLDPYDREIGLAKPGSAPDDDPEIGDDTEEQLDFRRVSRLETHRPTLDRDLVCDHRSIYYNDAALSRARRGPDTNTGDRCAPALSPS